MHYTTDAHSLIWFLTADSKLSIRALNIFEKADEGENVIIVPTIVLAEIMHICEKKRADLEIKEVIDKIKNSANYMSYSLDMRILDKVETLKNIPEIHDRIITATALLTRTDLITKDKDIIKSGIVKTIW